MRAFLILLLLILIGIFVGRGIWPDSHPEPDGHQRYHRGKIPAEPGTSAVNVRETDPHPHHRVLGGSGQ